MGRKIAVTAILAAALALPAALHAQSQVRSGVEAWADGDFAEAVAAWQGPAAAGDADAQFNLAQAYRLGRGVPQDESRAEALYASAARQGHLRAADTYGLLLFQDGRQQEALPYIESAARRGDPRSQYLLGIAHFNGQLVARDWVRAYALLTLANAEGLPQAAGGLAQMDQHVPLDQRQRGAALAQQMRLEAEDARERENTAAELARTAPSSIRPTAPPRDIPTGDVASTYPQPTTAIPRPIRSVEIPRSVAAAEAAVREAARVTGRESPADAGADYTRSAAPVQARQEPAAPPPARVAPAPAPVTSSSAPQRGGPWRVQLGAFSVEGNAERLWARVADHPALSGTQRILLDSGRVTRLQAGGFASRSEATSACAALRRSGQDCLVTR